MIDQIRWDSMWKFVDNTDQMASEDGVNFYPVNQTHTCPWNCGKPGCWFEREPE